MDRPKLMKFSDPLSVDLIVEILARLPSSRAAIRLKLVCKSWCSLISSHYFITFFNHRRHHLSLPPIHPSSSGCLIFRYKCFGYLSMVCWDDAAGGGFHRSDFSFLPCPKNSINLVALWADLILCSTSPSHFEPKIHYVCNPLTKHWVALPRVPQFQLNGRIFNVSTGFLCVPAPCSLCSTQCIVGDNNNNNYYNFMVVRISSIPTTIDSQFNFEAKLFLSEEGKWKSLVISSPQTIRKWIRHRSSQTLIPYKGMLHWLVSGFILVYDPYNCPKRFCRVIDTPSEEERFPQVLGLFQDRLCVTEHSSTIEGSFYYIWLLEDYNMGKWSLVQKLCQTSLPHPALLDHPHLDPKIRETGFSYIDGSTIYWTDPSGEGVPSGHGDANGIVHWITDQRWPTPVPPLTNRRHKSKWHPAEKGRAEKKPKAEKKLPKEGGVAAAGDKKKRARGLDVMPTTISHFRNEGDNETADLLETVVYKQIDFEEFCAAAISVYHLEALENWGEIASAAFENFDREGNRVISVEELAHEQNLGPTAYALLKDWIRADGKLNFVGYTKFLHGVTIRSANARFHR